ncbi:MULTISPECIES: DUF1223 domain-containing protein [unclassified Paracoccus (in: a-proteobacteria)]|uniref:DUF1223 domain-containing protein n=1 Tax=unclassified Paracoccus (in: a-proteobacteria) TaxID=2688777 RepID=UPI001E5011FC|nr:MULTISPECIES: DUF1223 domain-containing protein [unclassified Paracoccus (in: a-proteobacteria)]UXU74040.1 DUF1223 domain-containing protein [Paracoccus sp. SMMA_5]UXU79929.1 DUF1223 domain-containing protein [Paracoccus sp. SMMA_5_TC]
MALVQRMTGRAGKGGRRLLLLALTLLLWGVALGGGISAQAQPGPDGAQAAATDTMVDSEAGPAAAPGQQSDTGRSLNDPATGDSLSPGSGDGALIEAPAEPGTVPATEVPADPNPDARAAWGLEIQSPQPGPAAPVNRFTESQGRQRLVGPIDHPPIVIELFTSQGCSSCPPADEMLADLADRQDVLALSWHVDYWDYLGWVDEFARPEFTLRQQAYAHQSGERAIYTPQMIVGGTDTLIALRPAEVMTLLHGQMARPAPVMVSARQDGGSYRIDITPRRAIGERVAIILVRYLPSRKVPIRAGENRGLTVEYRNIVVAAERVAEWDGRAPLRISVTPEGKSGDQFPGDTRHAILAQQLGQGDPRRASGPILAAIRLD